MPPLIRFVKKGELVQADQMVSRDFRPLYSYQTSVEFGLYCCEDNNAYFTYAPGMRKLAEVELPHNWAQSSSWVAERRYPLDTEMWFGGTELRLTATVRATGEKAQATVHFEAE
jgi:hypothetical protein